MTTYLLLTTTLRFLIEIYPYTYYVTSHKAGHLFALTNKVFFHLISHLIASFMEASVIGHGNQNIAKWRNLLNHSLFVYGGDKQAPPGSHKSFQRVDRWQIQDD